MLNGRLPTTGADRVFASDAFREGYNTIRVVNAGKSTMNVEGVELALRFHTAADDATALRLVPFPKQVHLRPGEFLLDSKLVLEVPAASHELLSGLIGEEFRRAGLATPDVRDISGDAKYVRLSVQPGRCATEAGLSCTGDAARLCSQRAAKQRGLCRTGRRRLGLRLCKRSVS